MTDTDPIARFEWRAAATGLIIFLLGYLAFLAGIDTPDHPYFDETHYVPAARQLLQTHFGVPTLNALWATAIAALNQMLFVQARIGMLDIFALAFVLWGLAAFMMSFRARALVDVAGLCFGLATACKWCGVFGWGCVSPSWPWC